MDNDWKCIVLDNGTGGALNEGLRTILVSAAAVLYYNRFTRFSISSPYCDGVLTTTWRECNIERVIGFVFKAKVEDAQGYHELSILVAEEELKRGAEILDRGGTVIADLTQPGSLSSRLQEQARFFSDDAVPKRTN